MKSSALPRFVSCAVSLFVAVTAGRAASLDTNRIEQITGLKGTWSAAEGVFKVSQPRNDVAVKVDEWKMPPFMGLTSWAAFLAGKKADSMIMGDFAAKAAQFDKKKPILVNCHVGSRGAIAAAELARLGFTSVFNLEGGVDAWEKAGNHPETTGAH